MALIVEIEEGWVRVAEGSKAGWVQGSLDNIVALPLGDKDFEYRLIGIKEKSWPLRTKLNVVQRKPQIGFSRELLDLTLGKPTSDIDETTAKGTLTRLTYRQHIVESCPTAR